jgi:chemotaxis protein MotB
MKEKPNEWVSIADLMAGVVAVAMLLFVLAVLKIGEADKQRRDLEGRGSLEDCKELVRAMDAKSEARRVRVARSLDRIRIPESVGLVDVDTSNLKVTFRENTFESGSACMPDQNKGLVREVGMMAVKILEEFDDVDLFVDGHADAYRATPSTDFIAKCAPYSDNHTLSAARANEVRKLMVAAIGGGPRDRSETTVSVADRISVNGYGDARPLPGIGRYDERNRRVELRFVVRQAAPRQAEPKLLESCLPETRGETNEGGPKAAR